MPLILLYYNKKKIFKIYTVLTKHQPWWKSNNIFEYLPAVFCFLDFFFCNINHIFVLNNFVILPTEPETEKAKRTVMLKYLTYIS